MNNSQGETKKGVNEKLKKEKKLILLMVKKATRKTIAFILSFFSGLFFALGAFSILASFNLIDYKPLLPIINILNVQNNATLFSTGLMFLVLAIILFFLSDKIRG